MSEKTRTEEQSQGISPELPVLEDVVEQRLPVPGGRAEPEEGSQDPVADDGLVIGQGEWSERGKFSQDVHGYLREYIRLADQKAAFFFAGGTALLAFLYRNGVVDRWLRPLMEWNVIDVVAFVATGALMVSSLVAVWTVIPRTGGSRRGTIFWEAIAECRSARDYADHIMTRSGPSLARARAEHCFELAVICRSKYRVLRVAVVAGAIGLAASLIIFLVL